MVNRRMRRRDVLCLYDNGSDLVNMIVQYFIEREAYSIHEVNAALFEHGEQCLTEPQEIK